MFTVFIILGCLAGIYVVFALGTMIYAGIIAAPYVPTPKRAIYPALGMLGLKSGEVLYDLGSGTGNILIAAVKKYGVKGIGFELSLLHYRISKIKIWLSGCSDRINVFWCDLLGQDISKADAVFCWLTPRGYPKLREKFEKELRSGTRIVTFSSPLAFWPPEKIETLPNGARIFLYIKR